MLRSLHVERLRSFIELDLDFAKPSGSGGWTIFVGENGVGKTTILQAIALASLDTRAVSALIEAPWTLCRAGTPLDSGAVVRLSAREQGHNVSRERLIPAAPDTYIESSSGASHQLPELLVAFAARRRMARPGEEPQSENMVVERLRGLFHTDQPLLASDPFGAFSEATDRRNFAKVVRDVLVMHDEQEHLFPLIDSYELRGQSGITKSSQLLQGRRFQLRYGKSYEVRVALQDLSDGYQAMFGLVTEILSQAALFTGEVPDPSTLEAIVLVDELEAHLHPRWQHSVVPLLRKVFPRCQFIATTHSPLVAASALPGEIHILSVTEEGYVRQERLDRALSMDGAERIYEEVFGVHRTAPPDLQNREREYLLQLATGVAPDPKLAALIEKAWRDAV